MNLFVTCECGQKKEIIPANCGSSVNCICGKTIDVPRLSDVRRSCGQTPYATTIIERLHSMSRSNELPPTDRCCCCQSIAIENVSCIVQCESHAISGPGFWKTCVMIVLSPSWILSMLLSSFGTPEVHGRATAIRLPLPVCGLCKKKVLASDAERKKALRNIPLYEELLLKYPDAFTVIAK